MKSVYDSILNRQETWLATVRDDLGYHGPAIGTKNSQLGFCLRGFDWRYEGILKAWEYRHLLTGDDLYLLKIKKDISQITNAQLRNGTFKNSHFSEGPYEGGMPHEPAMLNAAVIAAVYLESKTSYNSISLENCLVNYVDKYLLPFLWNKLLRTFNNWPFSDFQNYSPVSVAAVIELLWNYGCWKGRLNEFRSYILEAGESLITAQCKNGPSEGAMASLFPAGSGYSPFFTARCLKALQICGALSGNKKFSISFKSSVDYIIRHQLPQGGFIRTTYNNNFQKHYPIMLGTLSGILFEFKKTGLLESEIFKRHFPLILKEQSLTGAFHTAIGFDRQKPSKDDSIRDYRDLFPVCGWNDKVFAILSSLSTSSYRFKPIPVAEDTVVINSRKGKLIETSRDVILLNAKGQEVYHWCKLQDWPSKVAL